MAITLYKQQKKKHFFLAFLYKSKKCIYYYYKNDIHTHDVCINFFMYMSVCVNIFSL